MKPTLKQHHKSNQNQKGFTLLETLLAIGILSVVVAQVVSVQSTQISVSQIARDNIRATWALRHMASQVDYVVDTLGVAGLPKDAVEIPWSADPDFTIRLDVKELNLAPSKMITTAMQIAKLGSAENADEKKDDSAGGFKEIASMLDSQLPKDLYRSYMITVSWKEGEKTRSIEGGGIVIDNKAISGLIKTTSALAGQANGGGAAGGAGAANGGSNTNSSAGGNRSNSSTGGNNTNSSTGGGK